MSNAQTQTNHPRQRTGFGARRRRPTKMCLSVCARSSHHQFEITTTARKGHKMSRLGKSWRRMETFRRIIEKRASRARKNTSREPSMQNWPGANDRRAISKGVLAERQMETAISLCSGPSTFEVFRGGANSQVGFELGVHVGTASSQIAS